MKYPRYAALAALLTVLAGCASLGLIAPKSFSERLAYAYSQNTALRQAAANSLNSGTLSSQDGEYVLQVSDQTRQYIDASRFAFQGGDVSTAEGRLTLAIGVLDQLQAYLSRKVTP